MPGRTLDSVSPYRSDFGRYLLLQLLNEPFVGTLYLAIPRDLVCERAVVLKVLGPRLTDAGDVARFREEASAVVRLSHRNLVSVLDAGLVGDEAFLAMDLVEGRDLRTIWNRCAKTQQAFPIAIAVYLVEEPCRGLAHVHAATDLVHRNIAPPKILVSYAGEIKLGDFSLALSAPVLERTEPEFVYGKVPYLSPEQERAEPLDGRSDLYSAAIVLWEMLTGRQLFPPRQESHPGPQRARAGSPGHAAEPARATRPGGARRGLHEGTRQ